MSKSPPFDKLDAEIVACRQCPRLVEWRERVAREKRASFKDWEYWGKPVPNFGDAESELLIVGLAPAAHGANRTGRMFTGDRSGDWLYRALHKAGLASQPESYSCEDGLQLRGVLITAAVHCAPPDNKPLPEEFSNCAPYLERILSAKRWKGILCLGSIAWQAVHRHFATKPMPKFAHGATFAIIDGPKVVGSYHPSQQNTFTGRLTEQMLDEALRLWMDSIKTASQESAP